MKKIIFPDKYGLTQAVIDGRKTQTRRIIPDIKSVRQSPFVPSALEDEHGYELKSKYKVGEIVAVVQSYKDAGVKFIPHEDDEFGCIDLPTDKLPGYTNKRFVRADLMPHRIRITAIRIERLQDISFGDCIKEGILYSDKYAMRYGYCDNKCPNGVFFNYSNPREAYADLIDKINGKGTWENNPFVWVYEFELF